MAACCLGAALVCATSPAGAGQPRPVDCRLLWFDSAAPPPRLVHVASDGVEVACEFPGRTISQPIRCTAEEGAIRFRGAADSSPAASARIPAELRRALLVFLPAAPHGNAGAVEPELPLRVFVIDDSPERFPDAGAFVVNFYAREIRFMIGEQRNQLRPGDSHGFPRPDRRDPFNMAPVIVQFQQGTDWRTVSESTLRFIPGLRYLVIAHVDPASGRPRIATFPDIRPAAAPAP